MSFRRNDQVVRLDHVQQSFSEETETIQLQQYDPDTQDVYDQRIRADLAGVPPPPREEDLISIRLNSHKFLNELWMRLAGRAYTEGEDGIGYLEKVPHIKPIMNDEGARHIIHAVSSVVNPTVTLGKISDHEYIAMADELEKAIAEIVVDRGEEFGIIRMSTKKLLMASLSPLIRGQLSRSVNGFEAQNLITQITEQRAQSDIKESVTTSSRGILGGRRGET